MCLAPSNKNQGIFPPKEPVDDKIDYGWLTFAYLLFLISILWI